MKTTLNVHTDILEKVSHAAKLCGVSRSEIIISLMRKVMNDIYMPAGLGIPVKYQLKNSSGEWQRFHIRLRDDEYEYFLDLRKVLKMSVSLILAHAVKKFLKVIMKIKSGDNYRLKNYILSKKIVEGVIIWKLFWGIPPNLERYI